MPFLMVLAAACLIYQWGQTSRQATAQVAPFSVARASDELDHYRAFLYLSDRFMTSYGGSNTALQLSASDLMSELGVSNVGGALLNGVESTSNALSVLGAFKPDSFPSTWRLVVRSPSQWVSCTPLSEEAIGMLSQWIQDPLSKPGRITTTASIANPWVIGQDPSFATWCP